MSETDYPITFEVLQQALNKLGYFLVKLDGKVGVHWKREPGSSDGPSNAHWPPFITTGQPDCTAKGYDKKVYDRNYVIDLVNHITGQAQDGVELLAALRKD